MKQTWVIFKNAFSGWRNDNISVWAAALSYYTAFSLSPLLLLILSIAGIFLGREAVEGQLAIQLQSLLGKEAGQGMQTMLAKTSNPATNLLTTILSVVTLILGATGVFGQLRQAMNAIFEVKEKKGFDIVRLLQERVFSFSIVAVLAFLLLVSLAVSSFISAFTARFNSFTLFEGIVMEALNIAFSIIFITIIFTIIFTILPSVHIPRKIAIRAAFLTSILFTIGKTLLGLYIGNSALSSTYGAAASLAIILVWVFYVSQIVFFGAEYIKTAAKQKNVILKPKFAAVPVVEASAETVKEQKPPKPAVDYNPKELFYNVLLGAVDRIVEEVMVKKKKAK